MEIEISIGHREPQSIYTEFEHYAYCDSIDEAINILITLKKGEILSKPNQCHKCVYEAICNKSNKNKNCKSYKRDPPDGGYYG